MPPRSEIRGPYRHRFTHPKSIPKGTSNAANPETKSFLDLPGEIRNHIYELAYQYPDALMVNPRGPKLRLCRRLGDRNGEDPEPLRSRFGACERLAQLHNYWDTDILHKHSP